MKRTALVFALLLSAPAAHAQCVDPVDPSLQGLDQAISQASKTGSPCGAPLALGNVLASQAGSPEGRQAILDLAAALGRETGRPLSAQELDALLADPASVDRLLTVSIPQVVANLKKAQELAALHPAAPKPLAWKLPNGVDLGDAAGYFDAAVDGPKPIQGGLLKGDPSAGLPDAQVRSRRALAEILDRLSDNLGKTGTDRFHVTYRGHAYSTPEGLLGALEKNGNHVSATVVSRVANFIDLRAPNAAGGSCPILATVMIDTGYKDAAGNAIAVPGVHSSMRFDVSGPDLDAAVDYYQGTDGTGFFASGLHQERDYLGHKEADSYRGADAIKAMSTAALWRESVDEIAAHDHLLGGGYGQTGVCNDSVAMLQLLLSGRTTLYPLAMDHDKVDGWLDGKIAEGGPLAARYRSLKDLVARLPADTGSDPTQPGRILGSIPFADGPQPLYPGVDAARETLGSHPLSALP